MPGEQILQPWAFPVLIFLGCSLPFSCWELSNPANQGRWRQGLANYLVSIQMLFNLASQQEPTASRARFLLVNVTQATS